MRVIPFYTHGHSTHVSVQSLIRPLLGLCFDIEVVSMSFFFVRFKHFRHAVFDIKFSFQQSRVTYWYGMN